MTESKNYLKFKHSLNLEMHSNCLMVCERYALSNPTNKDLQQNCDEEHNLVCQDLLMSLHSVKSKINEILDSRKKDELKFDYNNAEKNIFGWLQHNIRGQWTCTISSEKVCF